MEQSMIINTRVDSENKGLVTPCRVQKSLFVPPSSSSKRSLFQEGKEIQNDITTISDAESDLGPMSPLALTDHSSCDSSPGRQFISPLATPEKSPVIPLTNWNQRVCYTMKNISDSPISPFSSLRKITRSAIFSPKRMLGFSPKSKSSQSSQNTQADSTLTTPDSADETLMPEEVVPESPSKDSDFDDQQSYVAETPQKEEYSEYRLITPLGSVCKNIPIPRIHRRKSLGHLESDKCTSPENKKSTLKRNAEDPIFISNPKYQKIDELSTVPRARAALFQESHKIISKNEFTLNPRSFYGSHEKSRKSVGLEWRQSQPELKKRRSLPSYSSMQKRAVKKHRNGQINCGVGHGIKKPKPKRQPLQSSSVKDEKSNKDVYKINESKENLNPQTIIINTKKNNRETSEIDPNKKFFKSKFVPNATVTVNNKIKLKVTVKEKDAKPITKKARLNNICLDGADLSVDEPAIEASLQKNKVENILKILENDWADEEYDTMDTTNQALTSKINTSPKKSSIKLKNLTMSPASELSNMASTMNIEDISVPKENSIASEIPSKKFYPLFSKGYVSNIPNDEINLKKRKRNTSWQLSTKYGNSEKQYQIDAGQKIFGASQCSECGIIYHVGDADDENAHLNYHNSLKVLKFQGWKNERVIFKDSFTSSRILLIEPKDSNLYWKKITEVLEVVDRDLGLSDMQLSYYRDKRVYMYVRDKTIIGVLVAEYVKSAFQMIPELIELNCCTSETTPVKCGVNVVWTAMSHRRQGIATKLVDVLRANYYYGYVMSIDDIAFSTPTPSGKSFAENYTKTRNFKVYS